MFASLYQLDKKLTKLFPASQHLPFKKVILRVWKVFKVFQEDTKETAVSCSSKLLNKFKQTTFCFIVFMTVFNKQVNIRCSIGSISSPTSWRNHNASDKTFAIESYQSNFRKRDFFFWTAIGCNKSRLKKLFFYSLPFLHGGNDFQSS